MELLALEKDGGTSANSGVFDVVFERMKVAGFDCHISNLIAEPRGQSGEIEERVRGIDIIPAAKEFGCSPANPTKGTWVQHPRNRLLQRGQFRSDGVPKSGERGAVVLKYVAPEVLLLRRRSE